MNEEPEKQIDGETPEVKPLPKTPNRRTCTDHCGGSDCHSRRRDCRVALVAEASRQTCPRAALSFI